MNLVLRSHNLLSISLLGVGLPLSEFASLPRPTGRFAAGSTAASFRVHPRCTQCASLPAYFLRCKRMLGVGLEPTRIIHPRDFKSPVSTIPPSKQKELGSLFLFFLIVKRSFRGKIEFFFPAFFNKKAFFLIW